MTKPLAILSFLFISPLLYAQGFNTEFGSSTRQYHVHDWKYISSTNFDAYYYGDAHELAETSLIVAEKELKEVEDIVDYRFGTRSQIILYQSDYDFRHSNHFNTATPFNKGGYAYTTQNKIITYFDGSRENLRISIRYGLGELLVKELMYGGSFQERLRASTLLYMPEWFYKGLLSYLAEPWNTKKDDQVRDAIQNGAFKNLNLLSGPEAELAGHSWWNYIGETYGIRSISDILYLTRVSRNYDNALNFVLGNTPRSIFIDWHKYYEIRYSTDPGNGPLRNAIQLPKILAKRTFSQMKISPNSQEILLAGNYLGQMEIWVLNIGSKEVKRLYKSDDKGMMKWDANEPAITWSRDGKSIHAFLHLKGILKHLEVSKKGNILQSSVVRGINQVQHVAIHPKKDLFLLSATHKGQSDLFLYENLTLTQLTNDPFDDQMASFNADGSEVLFQSNREQNGLNYSGTNTRMQGDSVSSDIYSIPYPLVKGQMRRITATPFIHEVQAQAYPLGGIAYLSDNNGIYNTYVTLSSQRLEKTLIIVTRLNEAAGSDTFVVHGELNKDKFRLEDLELDSASMANAGDFQLEEVYKEVYRHYPLSDYARNIHLFATSQKLDIEAALYRYNSAYYIQVLDISWEVEKDAQFTTVAPTSYRNIRGNQAFISDSTSNRFLVEKQDLPVEETITIVKADTTPKEELYYFQTGFPEKPKVLVKKKSFQENEILYQTTPSDYKTSFFPNFLVTQLLDNSIINTPYYVNNGFSSTFNTFSRPNLNARMEASMTDLFNDQTLVVGGRIPVRLYSSDFYLNYTQRKYKRDFGVQFFRMSRLIDATVTSNRVFIHEIRPFMVQPLPKNMELRFSPFARFDRNVTNATDQGALETPDEVNEWVGASISLVYDCSMMEELNFPVGVRAKIYLEHFQNISSESRSTSIIGMDLRWYKKLGAKVLWANRLSATASFGSSAVNFQVGGPENWLANKFNGQLNPSSDYSYSFNSLVSGLRGFNQNARNGGHSMVLNSELRIPIVSYMSQTPTNMSFLRNLQLVGFFDMGSAWNSWNPFVDQHYNTRVIDQGSLRIVVRNKNNPFLSSVGTGLRTRVFGYYVRGDVAWGIENGVLANDGKAQWYFSLGYDF